MSSNDLDFKRIRKLREKNRHQNRKTNRRAEDFVTNYFDQFPNEFQPNQEASGFSRVKKVFNK